MASLHLLCRLKKIFLLTTALGGCFWIDANAMEQEEKDSSCLHLISTERKKISLEEEKKEEESTEYNSGPEIRKIIPPKLDNCHIGQKIKCYRPVRKGKPMMDVVNDEKIGKIIANNYGHGGSGWTLAPGAARYVNDLLIDTYHLSGETPIIIIGAGVIGLFTAYDLTTRGFHNIKIVADRFDDLTSHKAGGQVAIASMSNSLDEEKRINQIGIATYRFYDQIIQGALPDIKEGVKKLSTYFESKEESGLEPYVSADVMKPAKDVVLDFGNGTTRQMVSYDDGIFIDTGQMMSNLTDYLKSRRVPLIQQKVESFSDVKEKYIINCTGLGAKELNHDDAMVSVQGHLIMLRSQEPSNLQYMLVATSPCKRTRHGEEFYIFPKHLLHSNPEDIGVIGGTFIEGATDETPNEEQFEYIIQNAREFYGL